MPGIQRAGTSREGIVQFLQQPPRHPKMLHFLMMSMRPPKTDSMKEEHGAFCLVSPLRHSNLSILQILHEDGLNSA